MSAWDGDKMVGCARAISDGAFNAYVSGVVVHDDYRGRGIAREMVRRLMVGRDEVLFVLHARAALHSFYKSLGFADAPDMLRRERRL
jgi:predicted GNAT family acetyltransferase